VSDLDAYENKKIQNINDAEDYFLGELLEYGSRELFFSSDMNTDADTSDSQIEFHYFVSIDRDIMFEAHNY
jgi:hypothetical protein